MKKQTEKRPLTGFVIAAAIALASLLGACAGGSDPDAYNLYSSAATAVQDAEGFSMDIYTETSMETGGEPVGTKSSARAEMNSLGDGGIEMKITQKSEAMGEEYVTVTYYKDGFMYMNAAGEKMKLLSPPEDVMAQLRTQGQTVLVFSEAMVRKSAVETTGDTKKVTLSVDAEAVMGDLLGDMSGSLGGEMNLSFEDVVVTAVIDSAGKLTESTMSISMSTSYGGETTTTVTKTKLANIVLGKTDIAFPGDLDSYKSY